MRTAFLFPGQGAQCVGMGREWYDASPLARDLFDRADALLGFPLSTLCFNGPEAELRRTENAQPALFTVGAVAAALLRERGVPVDFAAGHSVGEYAALLTAGAVTYEAGLRAVRRRGELMSAAAEHSPGAMAAIIGLPLEIIEGLCTAAATAGFVEVANENGPSQTVISGEVAGVERAMELAEEEEGAVAVPLAVSGAFHSRLMAPVAAEFSEVLSAIDLRPAEIPVFSNVDAAVVRAPVDIREALVRQITGRVRWSASLLALAASGAERLIDVGPGRTLAGISRALLPGIEVSSADEVLASPHPARGLTPP